jgi:phage terminase large subunit-like protein
LGWGRAWARKKVLEVRKEIVPQLTDFMRQGDLILAPDAETQANMAAEICDQVFQTGLLPEKAGIGLDVAGIALLIDALEDRNMSQPLVTAVPQTWKLQQATQTVALKLEDGRFLHGGQPIMAWAVGNAKQELQGSTYVVRKSVAGAAKIDPLAALFDAAALMVLNPVASGSGAFVYQGM